jgi:hypothetical protein
MHRRLDDEFQCGFVAGLEARVFEREDSLLEMQPDGQGAAAAGGWRRLRQVPPRGDLVHGEDTVEGPKTFAEKRKPNRKRR